VARPQEVPGGGALARGNVGLPMARRMSENEGMEGGTAWRWPSGRDVDGGRGVWEWKVACFRRAQRLVRVV